MIGIHPFEKAIPSVFVVCSPFQLLCAIAAIRQLEIKDYKLIVYFPKGDVRNAQLRNLLNEYGLKYSSITCRINRIVTILIKLFALIPWKKRYPRLFVGDLRSFFEHIVGYCYLANNGNVIYLDDGTVTISFLNNVTNLVDEKVTKSLEFYKRHRGISYHKNFLTIFGDITNLCYNISLLRLDVVRNGNADKLQPKDIYIVGTNVDSFCKVLNLPEDFYIEKLGSLMEKLCKQYPNDRVVFIPHGNEYKDYGERLCKKYGCIFCRPSMMIELELLNRPYPPKAILGYTSTALYTLKKLFPSARIVNILFESSKDNLYFKAKYIESKYYQKNGIELVMECLS